MDLKEILKEYDLTKEEINEIVNVIGHIYNSDFFQIRMSNKYLHHGNMTLGRHILEDVVLTYKLSKKVKRKDYNQNITLKIAMFHDLYTESWQNNPNKKKFINKHGFRHPIEAVINAYSYFKDDFTDYEEIIIDGIIHHMYPFPVIILNNDKINNRELNNYDLFVKLPKRIKEIIYKSTNRNKLFNLSWSKSKYLEGKIVSKADKKASLKEFNNLSGIVALITGKNKTIE